MRRALMGAILAFVAITIIFVAVASAADQEMWLHVKVQSTRGEGETVRVNVPISLAEKVIPLIKSDEFHGGKIKIGDIRQTHDVDIDLPALMAAVRDTKDGEFVTVQSKHENVRVAKENGNLVVAVRDSKDGKNEKVDVTIPLSIVEAMTSTNKDEIDVLAVLKALRSHGDLKLVTAVDGDETVGVWIDSKNTIE